MNLVIDDFFPKYPTLGTENTLDPSIDPYNSQSDISVIVNKKEFNELSLEKHEVLPKVPGTQLNHQKFLSRFMSSHTMYDKVLLMHSMGCVHPLTPVILWNGDIVKAHQVRPGDLLIGDDGNPREVEKIITGKDHMYRVSQGNGESYLVNRHHVLSLVYPDHKKVYKDPSITKVNESKWFVKWFDREQYKVKLAKFQTQNKAQKFADEIDDLRIVDINVEMYTRLDHDIREGLRGIKCSGINWKSTDIKIDPYILGTWLTSGCILRSGKDIYARMCFIDRHIKHYWQNWANTNGYDLVYIVNTKNEYSVQPTEINTVNFVEILKAYNLVNINQVRRIPHEYIVNDKKVREGMLRGIIDSIGYVKPHGMSIELDPTLSLTLSSQIELLARSIGVLVTTSNCDNEYSKIEFSGSVVKTMGIKPSLLSLLNSIAFEEDRAHEITTSTKGEVLNMSTTPISVKYEGIEMYKGWELIDSSKTKRFLLGDMTVTHNTGKTCSSIGVIEANKHKFKGAVILAKNQGILKNYQKELVEKCTDGRYRPEGYEFMNDTRKSIHVNKLTRYYELYTFETFVKHLKKIKVNKIRKLYSNKIIVIDEVHNLRPQESDSDIETYNTIHMFLHSVTNAKVLLMSGTPMKDSVKEIATVMNLILPMNKQLPTDKKFMTDFFVSEQNELYSVKPEKVNELKEIFKSHVSYLKSVVQGVDKNFIGRILPGFSNFVLDSHTMGEYQTRVYKKAREKDIANKIPWYTNSRQASLFAFPDEKYGVVGFKKYISRNTRSPIMYKMNPTLIIALRGGNQADSLERLKKYSMKYYTTVKYILDAKEKGENTFVYCEFIEGSGLILLALILTSIFNFVIAKGTETGLETNGRSRIAFISGKTTKPNKIRRLIDTFNRDDNATGDIINVILGSKVLTEGYTLNNIRHEIILTPHWNYSETEQVIARGYRIGSHRALIEQGVVERPVVNIYQLVSIPEPGTSNDGDNNKNSVDLILYKLSENKDVSMRRVERLIKESAFDCVFNYKRNMLDSSMDNTRECEYNTCKYTCDYPGVDEENIDYSTYNLYYVEQDKYIKAMIKKLFLRKYTLTFLDIFTVVKKSVPRITEFQILSILSEMISTSTMVCDNTGMEYYLREDRDIYYLSTLLSNDDTFLSSYYARSKTLENNKTISDIVTPLENNYIARVIEEKLPSVRTRQDVTDLSKMVSMSIMNIVFESAIIAEKLGRTFDYMYAILDAYKNMYMTMDDGTVMSVFMRNTTGAVRCLTSVTDDDNETKWVWNDCKESKYIELMSSKESKDISKYETNPYGYYGQINPEDENKFCIRDVKNTITSKKHTRTSGKVCTTWKRKEILKMVLDTGMDAGDNILKNYKIFETPQRLRDALRSNKYIKDEAGDTTNSNIPIDDMNERELRNLLFWVTEPAKTICPVIRKWFKERDLLVEDSGCGRSTKKKV